MKDRLQFKRTTTISPKVVSSSKNRWMIYCKNEYYKYIYDAFVNLTNPPQKENNGDFSFRIHFAMYDEVGKAKKEFEYFKKQLELCTDMYLSLFDGSGFLIEEWYIENTFFKSIPTGNEQFFDEDYIESAWRVKYDKATLKGHFVK